MADGEHDLLKDIETPGERVRVAAFSPFRHPIFRAIWIANLFSNLGSTMQSIGAAWLMTELTPSHLAVAAVQVSATVPIMLFGMIAGAIADNFDRRRTMLSAQIGMLVASSILAALTYAGWISPGLLLMFTLSVGIGTSLNSPAWQSSVRQTVPVSELPEAIALNSISFNIARSIGPALGGLLMSFTDVSFVFAINAVSYLGLIGVLLWWRPPPRQVERRPIFPAIAVGIRHCAADRNLRRILTRSLALGVGIATYQSLFPSVVSSQIRGTEIDFGLLLGLFGLGSILTAPFIGRIRRKLGLEGIVALGVAMSVFACSVLGEAHTFRMAVPAAFVAGVAWVLILTTVNTAVQMRAPEHILGRCLSIYQSVTFGGMAVGSWIWGTIADLAGLPFALHAGSIFMAGSYILLRFLCPFPKAGEGVVTS